MIITIDEGTTSTRALLISKTGEILDSVQEEITQIYPQPGWIEHDALEIWNLTLACCKELISKTIDSGKASKEEFEGIAITNQRETTIVWDKKTGKPVYNAIVWQCKRTSDYCKSLKSQKKLSEYINQKTGLIVDSYFSATKISWILDHIVRINKDVNLDDLLFGTIDTWLIWNLTGKHFTDTTNASRTMLYAIHEGKWDELLLATFGIPQTLLPEVLASNDSFGSTEIFKDLLDKPLEIKAVLGDQQAAFYAYGCEAKITYGTGTFVLIPCITPGNKNLVLTKSFTKKSQTQKDPDARLASPEGPELTKSSMRIPKDERNAADGIFESGSAELVYEGSIFVGGSIVQWLRDELGFIKTSSEIEALAAQVKDNGGVYLIPALAGLGAPYWNENARGAIFGLTRGSNKAYIARAALESMAYSVKDVYEALDEKTKNSIEYINVDGGASKNNFLMQFQADLLQKPIRRFTETEMTALGVAKMTGLVELNLKPERIFEPQGNHDDLYKNWKRFVFTASSQ